MSEASEQSERSGAKRLKDLLKDKEYGIQRVKHELIEDLTDKLVELPEVKAVAGEDPGSFLGGSIFFDRGGYNYHLRFDRYGGDFTKPTNLFLQRTPEGEKSEGEEYGYGDSDIIELGVVGDYQAKPSFSFKSPQIRSANEPETIDHITSLIESI